MTKPRIDLLRDADIAEEVARFYGYDNIPTTLPSGESTTGKLSFKLRVEEVAREVAQFCGFSQGMTYSFESPKVFDKLIDAGAKHVVKIEVPESWKTAGEESLTGAAVTGARQDAVDFVNNIQKKIDRYLLHIRFRYL